MDPEETTPATAAVERARAASTDFQTSGKSHPKRSSG